MGHCPQPKADSAHCFSTSGRNFSWEIVTNLPVDKASSVRIDRV